MKRQAYMKPETLVIEIDMRQQMLAGSVTDVVNTGLDPADAITPDPDPIDSWDDAMGHEFDLEDEQFADY